MYVEIKASDEEGLTSGKRTWINIDDYKLSESTSCPEHLEYPNWHVEISGQDERKSSSGERSDNYRVFVYDLKIDLTPADLVKIVKFALSKGLIALTARPRKRAR